MLKLTNPRLRRFNVVVNSFNGCIADTSKEFSRAPEVTFSEVFSKPRMFLHQHPRGITFKQLQSHTHRYSWRHLDKKVDVVGSDIEFINFEPFSVSNLPQEKLTIYPESVKLERVFGIFNFPHKVERVLSKAVFSRFQIHLLSPKSATRKRAHANLNVYFEEPSIQALLNSQTKELNFEDGDSSPSLKARVSSPWM